MSVLLVADGDVAEAEVPGASDICAGFMADSEMPAVRVCRVSADEVSANEVSADEASVDEVSALNIEARTHRCYGEREKGAESLIDVATTAGGTRRGPSGDAHGHSAKGRLPY